MTEETMEHITDEVIENRIKTALVEALKLKLDPASLPTDLPLIDKGLGLDSVSILQLVGSLEDEFSIRIEDTDITRDLFRDISTISGYVRQKLNEQ
jgi:acyl carrier protein